MPRCSCGLHQRHYAKQRFRRREAVSALLRRLHLYWLQGWWDAGTDTTHFGSSRALGGKPT